MGGISNKLGMIEKMIERHVECLEKIRDVVVRLDERTEEILKFLPLKETKELVLSNLGKVKVTAEPGREETIYIIEFEKLIEKPRFIGKKALETGLTEEEKKLFGKEAFFYVLGPNRISIHVPSTNPAVCSSYISRLLKWLNTKYWEALKELEKYEEIRVE